MHLHQEIPQILKRNTCKFQILQITNVVLREIPFRRVQLPCDHETTGKVFFSFYSKKTQVFIISPLL